ncbi:prealbumin-like fold domain-containing protein [Lacticaseibacillus sharpeae]|uniref:prealbumin-like fold domain-containing protein n=1 Tax=Lacticaseibacillus sharpeae TaxID=1626 RepID=UPI000B26F977|nr:prealbumin-like fold domain-containing protein [Lacticaseibacillus sharpeae]
MRKKILQMLMVLVLVIPITFAGFRSKSTVAGDAGTNQGQALIIDPDAISNVTMHSSTGGEISKFNGANQTGPQENRWGGGDLQTWASEGNNIGWRDNNRTYMNFLNGAGMTGVGYTRLKSNDGGNGKIIDNEVLTLNYDNVGMALKDGHYVTVGADVKVSNIIYGSESGVAPNTNPYIIFSDNLYSGVLYGGIKAMDINFEFYDATSQAHEKIDFTGLEGELSFNSLNGNQGGNYIESTEFAGDGADDGQLSDGTILSYHKYADQNHWYMNGTYYGWNGSFTYKDDDYLGAKRFPVATVSFPLSGTSNDFTFGSAWGRAWTAFSSSSPFPVQQSAPTKTVEPADNSQGFDQRYDNDLDVFGLQEGSKWDFSNPQPGHNPDDNDLAAGVLPKNERYVDKGGSYYYYINQPTINLSTQGLVLPTGMDIFDDLQDGTSVNGIQDVTLYGLDGREIGNPFAYNSQASGQNIHLILSDSAVNTINEQSKQKQYYGKDFTVRIKYHVDNDAPNLIQNKAMSHFTYDNNDEFYAMSNKVDTQLRPDPVNVSFTKYDSVTSKALADATFTLYHKGEFVQNAISGADGQVNFTNVAPGSGYTIQETGVPANYTDPYNGRQFNVEITKDGQIKWLDNVIQNNRYPDNPIQKHYILHLDKVNADDAHALENAEFKLFKLDAQGKLKN